MVLYEDLQNIYKLLDFSPSHSRLLIRSMRGRERDYNIDIVFKPVEAVLLPNELNGVRISTGDIPDGDLPFLHSRGFENPQNNYKIFTITDINGRNHYVSAMACGVFHNDLDILESSISTLDIYYTKKLFWFS